MFLNFNYKKKFLNIFECQQATVRYHQWYAYHSESTVRASGATGPAMWHVAEDLNAERHHRENLELRVLFWRLQTAGLEGLDIVKCVIMACMFCVRWR